MKEHGINLISESMIKKENELLHQAIKAAKAAGEIILSVYEKDFKVEFKNDNSPLTIADQKANDIIEKHLIKTNIPILSEEGSHVYFERKQWDLVWIVDPLDGTKFVNRNGEFTVNIALIHKRKPVLGVIYVSFKIVYTMVLLMGHLKYLMKNSINYLLKKPIKYLQWLVVDLI